MTAQFTLQPLSTPLTLFPTYTAQKQESFLMKVTNAHMTRDHRWVSFVDPETGRQGQPFIEIDQPDANFMSADHTYIFKDCATNTEVMQVQKENHSLSPDLYYASAMGREVWRLEIDTHAFSPDDYTLTLFPERGAPITLPVDYKVAGQKRAIIYNGQPVATVDQPERFSHLQREDLIYVAQGMDILLAIGVGFCHAEQQLEKQKRRRRAAN